MEDAQEMMCVALCERVYTNGVEWMIGKGKYAKRGVEEIIEQIRTVREFLL